MDEPDGNLAASIGYIAAKMVRLIPELEISRVVSLGQHDPHADHAATYRATVLARHILDSRGYQLEHWASANNENGEVAVPSSLDSIRRKLGAMACHDSQYPIRLIDTDITSDDLLIAGYAINRDFWRTFPFRSQILEGERYDRIGSPLLVASGSVL